MAIKSKPNRKREIDLTGPDGNVYYLLGTTESFCKQLKEVDSERYDWNVIESKMKESDYENLIEVFDSYFGDFVDLVR
jgi:hypothetical protein